jgi:hypothetical protein
MDVPKSADQNYLPKLNFRSNSDLIKNQGRFGLVYKGKLDGKLDVAIKRVEKKKTEVAESQFYFKANGHPNMMNFYCLVAGDSIFT